MPILGRVVTAAPMVGAKAGTVNGTNNIGEAVFGVGTSESDAVLVFCTLVLDLLQLQVVTTT